METYSTQVMELLSLGRTSNGVYQMEIAITHEDSQGTHVIDIDEFTFLGLEALQPLDGGRARISPYPKWDPFRNTFYSVIVRTKGVSQETLYFACSEDYINQIKQIRQTLLSPVPGESDQPEQAAREPIKRRTNTRLLSRFYARAPRLVNLILIGLILLLIQSIPYQSRHNLVAMLGGQADAAKIGTALNEPSGMALSAAALPVIGPNKGSASFPVVMANHTSTSVKVQPAAQQKNYEVIDIDSGKKEFGLPKQYVALTFDDGPSRYTEQIVDTLTKHKVAATFLFIGENAKHYPDAVTYASKNGMSIGNHSWDHPVMTKLSAKEQSSNLSKTVSLLESLTNTPITLFRPPYGSINDELFSVAKQQHLKTLMWNRDPEDWNHKKPEDIVRYFHGVDASGGIYVLHEDKSTLEALPDILDYLSGKNLTFAIFK